METKDESAIDLPKFRQVSIPVVLLENVGLNSCLVQLLLSLSAEDLLNGGQERRWVDQSVNEDHLGDLSRVIFPKVHLINSGFDVFCPGDQLSFRGVGDLLPLGWHTVETNVVFQGFHSLVHGQLTLVGKIEVAE